jgi:hypothetical protein
MARGPGRLPLLAATVGVLLLQACSRTTETYPASTPDEALDSAQQMIINGDAQRLVELIYAESPEMRGFLDQIGGLLGSLQGLGEAVEQRFPEELAAFKAEAEQAAEEGGSPLLARLVAAGRGDGGRRNRSFGVSQIDREGLTIDTGSATRTDRGPAFLSGPQTESQRRIANTIVKQLLADPYGWLAEGRAKLDTMYIADDTVSLTWDDRPILPPFGVIMVQREDEWRVVPPTSYPGVNRVMPRSADEWFVWGSMAKTLEHVVIDLEKEVRAGRVRNMTDLADTAVEKAAIPAMLIFFAYGNLMEERGRAASGDPPADAGDGGVEDTDPEADGERDEDGP